MTRRSKKIYQANKFSDSKVYYRKPFWLSSINYYALTTGLTIASFFITWGILHFAEEEMPWITAGVISGVVIILAVFFREFVFMKVFRRSLLDQKRLDYNISPVYRKNKLKDSSDRITLERNSALLTEIENRSKTAKSIGNLPELHLEVFELCHEYLRKSAREIEGLFKESPRYLALRQGQRRLEGLHKFHLLSWASLESQQFIQTAQVQASLNDKIENAQKAQVVVDTAIKFYPNEESLLQSKEAIKEFIVSIKVSHWIELAERAEFKENYNRAISHYRDALFYLARENKRTGEHEKLAEQINNKIEKIRVKHLETN